MDAQAYAKRGSKRSRAIGYPWKGRLLRPVKLRETEYIKYTQEYRRGGHFYGTWELVQLLERAARRVAFRLPGAKLSVGELSGERGGHIDGHRSHENGRDVDVGFYMLDARGAPAYASSFAHVDRKGRGTRWAKDLRFDAARNWELVARLVSDGDAKVQHIFVADSVRRLLIREALRRKAPQVLIDRAERVMMQPKGHPHRNHFHVRIYCAPADQQVCRDKAPYWDWSPNKSNKHQIASLH